MNTAAPNRFKSLDLKKAIAAVDEHAAGNNIPDLTFPDKDKGTAEVVTLQTAASSLSEIVTPSAEPKQPAKTAAARKPKKELTEQREGGATQRITLDLPPYLSAAIAKRGFSQGASAKYIIMLALQNDGFTIKPEDMKKDGRRTRRDATHDE